MGTKIDGGLPKAAHVGLEFRPDDTDSIGTVTRTFTVKTRGRDVQHVAYTYAHAPEVTHERPWAEVADMAWAV